MDNATEMGLLFMASLTTDYAGDLLESVIHCETLEDAYTVLTEPNHFMALLEAFELDSRPEVAAIAKQRYAEVEQLYTSWKARELEVLKPYEGVEGGIPKVAANYFHFQREWYAAGQAHAAETTRLLKDAVPFAVFREGLHHSPEDHVFVTESFDDTE